MVSFFGRRQREGESALEIPQSSAGDSIIPPEHLESILTLRTNGQLELARDSCIEVLKSDPDRLDLQIVLFHLRKTLGDPGHLVNGALNGAVEIIKEDDASLLNDPVMFIAAIRVVLDLLLENRIEIAHQVAARIDKVNQFGQAEEVARSAMWIALGEVDLAEITLDYVSDGRRWTIVAEAVRELSMNIAGVDASDAIPRLEMLLESRRIFGDTVLGGVFARDPAVVPGASEPGQEHDQFSRCRWNRTKSTPLVAELNRTGDSLRQIGESVVRECRVSQYWLSEILARAENLEMRFRHEPLAPSTLKTGEMTVIIATDSRYIHGWVSHKGRGLPVSIRIEDWECFADERDQFAQFAFGMAILWFLDCALRSSGVGAEHFELGQDRRWRTNSSFDRDSRGRRVTPRAHRVLGHVRHLRDGRTPTDEARSRAPAYIRRTMGPDDTFVREHSRHGDANTGRLIDHLKKRSNVSDGLNLMREL